MTTTHSNSRAQRSRRGVRRVAELGLATLTYHRVSPRGLGRGYEGLISADPATFADQMQTLATSYNVVGIDAVLHASRTGEPLPKRSVLLTFDDAVDDFREFALPALERHELPSAVFVPTNFCDEPDAWFWWDGLHDAIWQTARRTPLPTDFGTVQLDTADDRAASFRHLRTELKKTPYERVVPFVAKLADTLEIEPPRARVMGWETLRSLGAQRVAVCAHTRSHAHLDTISPEQVRHEITGSFDDLRRHLGDVPPVFAYPSGQANLTAEDELRSAGVELAFTTTRGVNNLRTSDPLRLKRINVGRRGLGVARLQMYPTVCSALDLAQRLR